MKEGRPGGRQGNRGGRRLHDAVLRGVGTAGAFTQPPNRRRAGVSASTSTTGQTAARGPSRAPAPNFYDLQGRVRKGRGSSVVAQRRPPASFHSPTEALREGSDAKLETVTQEKKAGLRVEDVGRDSTARDDRNGRWRKTRVKQMSGI